MGRHRGRSRHAAGLGAQAQRPARSSQRAPYGSADPVVHKGAGSRAAEFSRQAHAHPRHHQSGTHSAPPKATTSTRPGGVPHGTGLRTPAPQRQATAPTKPASILTGRRGCDHVFFIGFLGAGKTTVARNLGNMFHRSFVDVDRMVERELHASVARIFATRGEQAFRDAETQALRGLAERRSLLVSCGGGIIERPENARIMHELGKVVYLDGTLEDSLRQIRRPDKRPDLGDREHARALYAHRRPLYEQACDYRVSISGKTFEEVAYEVGGLLWERGLL